MSKYIDNFDFVKKRGRKIKLLYLHFQICISNIQVFYSLVKKMKKIWWWIASTLLIGIILLIWYILLPINSHPPLLERIARLFDPDEDFRAIWDPSFELMIEFSAQQQAAQASWILRGEIVVPPQGSYGEIALWVEYRGASRGDQLQLSGDLNFYLQDNQLFLQPKELAIMQGIGHQMNAYWEELGRELQGKRIELPLAFSLPDREKIFSPSRTAVRGEDMSFSGQSPTTIQLSSFLPLIFSEEFAQKLLASWYIPSILLHSDEQEQSLSRSHREHYYDTSGTLKILPSGSILTARYNQWKIELTIQKKSDKMLLDIWVSNMRSIDEYYKLQVTLLPKHSKKPLQSLPNSYIPIEHYLARLDILF